MNATAWITAGLVLAAATGNAQTIAEQAEDKIRSTAAGEIAETERDRLRTTRTRSPTRTWSGIALAAAGAATALMGRTCRTAGSLPRESVLPDRRGYVTTSMTDLYAYNDGGECRIDFAIHVTGLETGSTQPSYQESHLYSELHRYTRQGLPDNLTGTARAERGLDRGRLYSGIAMAATGIALATIFADIPVRVTEISPSQITVGNRISW